MSTMSVLASVMLMASSEPGPRTIAEARPVTRAVYRCRNRDRRARLAIRPGGGDYGLGRMFIHGSLSLGRAWENHTVEASIEGIDHDWVYADYDYQGSTLQILFDRKSGELTLGGSAILLAPWRLRSDKLQCRVDSPPVEPEG